MTYPGGEPHADEEAFEAEEQLVLAEGDDHLPWLESDEDYEEDEGVDTGRIVAVALIGLLVISALLLASWFFLRDAPDGELVADGSTIEAPDEPYKQRPADPGGREVEGTGDTAYQVAEGQSRRANIAEQENPAPAPSIDREQAEAVAAGTTYVQIGAFASRADADTAWASESRLYPALSGMRHRIVEGEVNGATVYRLQAVAGDRAAGDALCRSIRSEGGDCYIRN